MREPGTDEVPRWVRQLVEEEHADFALISVRVAEALDLDEEGFRHATRRAYEQLFGKLKRREAAEPVRVWNFIPGILEPLGRLPHRYMAFNEGRYNAYLGRYGSVEEMERRVPTASAVGHAGSSLVVHCLTSTAGQSIENPRQIRASRYSSLYGPRPPCFARATRLQRGTAPWLLVGGTASVVGEHTLHAGDVAAQLLETVQNIELLVRAASVTVSADEVLSPASVRVYHVRPEDDAFLRTSVPARLASNEVEFIRTELCRPELLLEIEALYRPARGTVDGAG